MRILLKLKLALFGIALVFVSCSQNKEVNLPTNPYQEGQEVQLKVVTNNNSHNSPARQISGIYNPDDENVSFNWEWNVSNEEVMLVELKNNTDPLKRKEFKMTDSYDEEGVTYGIFTGVMPEGWTGSEELHVIAGNITDDEPLEEQSYVISQYGIENNKMRFEGYFDSLDDPIQLIAAWSVYILPIKFSPTNTIGKTLTNTETIHYYIDNVNITGNRDDSSFEYSYAIDYSGTQATKGTQETAFCFLIVKPGAYSNLSFAVTFDLDPSKCYSEGSYVLVSGQNPVKTFNINPTSEFILEGNTGYTTPNASCKYTFN